MLSPTEVPYAIYAGLIFGGMLTCARESVFLVLVVSANQQCALCEPSILVPLSFLVKVEKGHGG